ncbi:energy transducer TonB [Apibacter raozihei]|uniref:energy transducer TonB n=1 Tax=Apibacter raozihei TaxID=2500547 RepID=UPI000FE3F127|nr:energy transducer TonB [Apibacter raozihei]
MAQNKLKSLDDIVFEQKNKSYGAYRLRQNEKGYLLKAFLIGTTIFVLFVLVLYFYNRWQAGKKENEVSVVANLTEIEIPKEEEEIFEQNNEPPPPPKVEQEEIASIKVVVPEPKKVVVKEETVPEAKETENKVISTENKEGKATSSQAGNPGPKVEAPPGPPPPKPPVDDTQAFDNVEVNAEFTKGNVTQYISQFIEYSDRARDNGTQGNILIKFVVEKDGTITNVRVASKKLGDGLDEIAIKAVQKTNKMWKPGKIDGKPVRTNFRLPITFRLPPE